MLAAQRLLLVQKINFRKARALFFYLLHTPELEHRGEKIANLFWQDVSRKKAMSSLRQTIRQIRNQLADVPTITLETRRGQLWLQCQDQTALDRLICSELNHVPWVDNADEWVLRYLQEFDLLLELSGSFDSWLMIRLSQAEQSIATVLEPLYVEEKDSKIALDAARLAVAIEPANESAVRHQMRHFWRQDAAARAIELYNALYTYLDRELDQEPQPKTIDLLAEIKMGPSSGAADRSMPAPPETGKPRIVVQMVGAVELGAEESCLLTVLQHDFRMRLARFREWTILDSDRGADADLRISMELIPAQPLMQLVVGVHDPSSDALLWSEMVENPAEKWDEKARIQIGNISKALSLAAESGKAQEHEALIYDRWLQSQILIEVWTPKTEGKAIQILQDITLEAPRFGPAHAELAAVLNVRHIMLPGTIQSESVKQRALHHAIEAISLDPLDTRAHRVLAWCYCHKSEFELAEFHFEQALHLNESNSHTLASCALGYAFLHRLEQAEELISRIKAAPSAMQPPHLVYAAAVNYLCGDYVSTAQQCAAAGDIMATVGGWHSAALLQLGRQDEARRRARNYVAYVKQQWSGARSPKDADVLDWFAGCFPLRNEAVRRDLRKMVGAALT